MKILIKVAVYSMLSHVWFMDWGKKNLNSKKDAPVSLPKFLQDEIWRTCALKGYSNIKRGDTGDVVERAYLNFHV